MNKTQMGTKVLIAGAVVLVCCCAVFALNPSLDVSEYAQKSWKVREGFFGGPINMITQTPDGYLWIGTDWGLYRFDGVQSVAWQPRGNESLPSNSIRRLFVSRDGTLWIGTEKGLASWKDGKLTLYSELPAEGVDALAEDGEGTIWAGLEEMPAWRLCSIKNGAVQCFGNNGSLGLGKGTLLSDRKGNLWAGTGTGLWRWRSGSPASIPLAEAVSEIHAIIEDDQGGVLVSTRGGIIRIVDGIAAAYPLPDYGQHFSPFSLLRDRDGGLWIGTKDRGLLHVHEGRTDHFGKADGLSSDAVADLFEDREGNIWVGTAGGLDRFHEFAVSTMSVSEGFPLAGVESVLTARDGSIWLGTRDGLDRWKDGRLTLYRKKSEQVPSTVRQIIDPGLPDDFHSTLYEDHRGRIWIFSRNGAAHLDERGRFMRVLDLPGGFAHCVAEDRAGDLWISQDQGFFHLLRGGKVEQMPWVKLGGRGLALALAGDPSSGGLWLGFSDGGVAYFKDGKIRQRYTTDGLGEGRVNKLQIERDGTVWVGSEGGFSRIKGGNITALSNKNGLRCNAVHDFAWDNAESLWLHTSCGLVRIAGSELEAWLGDPKRTIESTIFDSYDGLSPAGILRGLWPRMGKSTDGKIWFASGDGVSVVDPKHLPFNKIPPPLHIEQITADGKTYAAANGLHLPPLVRNLKVDYTALSFVTPEKVRFLFKLEGQDKDWREVVNEREAQYSNLAPKNYRFSVKACNNSGVWNEEGASLDFVIPPAWYQTYWFRALCVAASLAVLWGLYLLRLHQLRQQEEKFREAVETMPGLAFVASSETARTFVNKGWIEYTGLTIEQASGSGWQAAVHPDDLKRVLDKWRTAAAAGEPFDYETRLRHSSDGEYRWFHTRVVPLRDKRGKVVKWCGLAIDIEDVKRAEQLQTDLAHVNRVSILGELAASIAHEVNQPLCGIVSNANATLRWLARDAPNLQEACQTARSIVRDGQRAGEIIHHLQSLYKKIPPKRELVDANENIGEMVVMLRAEANRFAVSIRTDLAADLPGVMVDRVQLQQVLMNLMLNGIEAMKDTGGVLAVKSQPDDGHVLISISDTGVGLPADKPDRIFDAFYTTKPQGSGMGLAISRSIIESHGGRLWATPNDGRGASFHFSLPIAVHAEGTPTTAD